MKLCIVIAFLACLVPSAQAITWKPPHCPPGSKCPIEKPPPYENK